MNIPKGIFSATAFAFVVASASFSSSAFAEDKDVTIKALDIMKYDTTAIEAEAGQTINITLTNPGKMPKVAMAHNLVILKPNTDVIKFVTAAARQAANGYIPVAEADRIITSTKLLGPGESDTVHFTPAEAGIYPFVCTFPAHAMAGMRGTITVR